MGCNDCHTPWRMGASGPEPDMTRMLSGHPETMQQFMDTIRSGRHMGRGRPILPPMPWPAITNLTDADLKSVFAYLRTIPAVRNRVPDPLPPAGAPN